MPTLDDYPHRRTCPICREPVGLRAVQEANGLWTLHWFHRSDCKTGFALTLLAEARNGRSDWVALALNLGLPATALDECAVQLGVLPPTEQTLGRLLQPLEIQTILRAYHKANGEPSADEDL
jgi:hypothetical protein